MAQSIRIEHKRFARCASHSEVQVFQEEPFPCLRGKVPKADGGALGAICRSRAFRAMRESLFFERQRKVTKRKPP